MSASDVSTTDAISRNINWASVIREVFSREGLEIMEVGVAMYTKPPEVELIFYSERDMKRCESVKKEIASGMGAFESGNEDEEVEINPATELFTLLDSARITKSVYKPLPLTAG